MPTLYDVALTDFGQPVKIEERRTSRPLLPADLHDPVRKVQS